MVSLAKYLGYHDNEYQTGAIGLEIETETKKAYNIPGSMHALWAIHPDGSLRDYGQEFVFLYPYNYESEKYSTALSQFEELVKQVKFSKSVYSSVHVHFNMLPLEVVHMFNFMALYFLFEEMLTAYCGPDRDGNLFCLKTSNAEYNIQQACEVVRCFSEGIGKTAIRNLNANALKYSALNLATLRNLGSLEIRTYPGTTDVSEIKRWISILNQLYVKCKTFKDPSDILREFRYSSPTAFAYRIFDNYASFLPIDIFKAKIRNPLWYLSKFASTIKDWKTIDKMPEVVKAPTRKKIKVNSFNVQAGQVAYALDDMATPTQLHHVAELNSFLNQYQAAYGHVGAVTLDEDL